MLVALERGMPVGAEVVTGGAHFRVWAPRRRHVDVVLEGWGSVPLDREENGYFSGAMESVRPGALYRFRLDHGDGLFPDPASRFQPRGPHGPSQVVDASSFSWTDQDWKGLRLEGQVFYEMHIGTLTTEGTWQTAQHVLPELRDLGITAVEVMPVAEFPGRFGWGYDGVDLFAPYHVYGTPDDFRSFVDRAHSLELGVILDVVYNHVGPDGNFLKEFSETYFTSRYENQWGEAINFDGPGSEGVREFVSSNARYWISEFHIDGLRLDATQQIFDASSENIVAVIGREARRAAGGRPVLIVAENERQEAKLARACDQGGYGLDALWNDDFHHAARVAATGGREAYYADYEGSPQELIAASRWGFLYQGQFSFWQRKSRGSYAFDLKPATFVNYIQNHDQIANSAHGARLHQMTAPGRYRALTALLLLSPGTPLLFQGQEFGASTPFLYFADHNPDLAPLVENGRGEFLAQFPSMAGPDTAFPLGKPHERPTFERCKLNRSERMHGTSMVGLHRDLLKLRREDPVFRAQRADWIQAAVLGPEAFVLRFFSPENGDRLLIVNLGRPFDLRPEPEPLLGDPKSGIWELLWSSDDPRYGGCSRNPMRRSGRWNIPGHCAVVMYERLRD